MKKNNYLLLLSLLLVFFYSCKKDDAPHQPVLPLDDNSLPSGAVSNIKITGRSSNTLEFSLDITVFRDSKNIENTLKPGDFIIDTLYALSESYYFNPLSISLEGGGGETPYSALMLMDQSGSIINTDPADYRLDAAKAFCNNLGQGDNVMLWSFAGSSQQRYGTGFTENGSTLVPDIEALDGQEGSATPLYQSQYVAINYTASNAPSSNKAVMTFTDGDDTQGGYSSQDIIDKASTEHVKLYNVGLGSAQVQILSNQAAATGGAFMFAQDARQLISMFGNLGKMLNQTAQYYHTSWKITAGSGIFNGSILVHKLRIMLPYNSEITVPFSLQF